MALFKILKGDSSTFSTNLTASNVTPSFHEGYCYFLQDTNMFYIDWLNGSTQCRTALNANNAKTLLDKTWEDFETEIKAFMADHYASSDSIPTKTSDLTNNSGYITSAQAPVQSFNGRTGAVMAGKGDYTPEMVGAATRPNLLDNWCFLPGYVVNQRGATDITAGGYGVDRWSNYNGRKSPCSVESDGIHLSCDGSKTHGYMQRMPSDDLIGGKQYTLSALYKIVSDTATGSNRNVALSYGTADNVTSSRVIPNAEAPIGEWVCSAYTFTAQDTTEALSNVRIRMNTYGATEIVTAAMKLELGDTQTLAHQDEDGNWVLNEYPDYSEQLLRCCMSTADPGDDYANNKRTPAAIGAVSKAGDTISGDLTVTGTITGDTVNGAVWNDYAEYRSAESLEPGRCVIEGPNGRLLLSTERLQPGANVISDTFGFSIGETGQCKTPIAVAGRVLAYTFEDRNEYPLGAAVCSGPNGMVSLMSREEIKEYPERIVGTVSEIPEYTVWGSGNIKVNGRIWIKVR